MGVLEQRRRQVWDTAGKRLWRGGGSVEAGCTGCTEASAGKAAVWDERSRPAGGEGASFLLLLPVSLTLRDPLPFLGFRRLGPYKSSQATATHNPLSL